MRPSLELAHAPRTTSEPVRLALLTTYDQECTVAEHAAKLLGGLGAAAAARGVEAGVLVLAEEIGRAPGDEDAPFVRRCWRRDAGDLTRALELLAREHVNVLHVEFHGEHFANLDLPGFLRGCRELGIRTFGSFHFREADIDAAVAAIALVDRAFVQHAEGVARFVAHGAPAERLAVLPLGAPALPGAEGMRRARRALDLPEDLELVVTCGLFAPGEGVHEVLRALPEVIARHPHVQYVVLPIGLPPDPDRATYVADCRAAAAGLGLERHVMLPDAPLPPDEAASYVAASDVVVLHHVAARPDAAASAAFALAQGRPLIVSREPGFTGLRDVALQVSPRLSLAHAVNQVLEQRSLAVRLEQLAQEKLEQHFYARLGEHLLAEYGALAGAVPRVDVPARTIFEDALRAAIEPVACERPAGAAA